jgi:Peptidase_C39 like family
MPLLPTEPMATVLERVAVQAAHDYQVGLAHMYLVKSAGDAKVTHALSGELYSSQSGWLLLNVPNALVRGAFDALDEPGAELPLHNGKLNAHITVASPEDIKQIGGIDKITERGHHFRYTLGPVQEVTPGGWKDVSKVWFIQVRSKELQDLRKSYGLSPRPNDDEYSFHITIGKRTKKVLQHNDVKKAATCVIIASEKKGFIPGLVAGEAWEYGRKSFKNKPKKTVADIAADAVEQDTAYLDALQKLPIVINPKKKLVKSPVVSQNVDGDPGLIKLSEVDHGLLAKDDGNEDSQDERGREGHNSRGSPVGRSIRVQHREQTTSYDCAPASLSSIFAYYGSQPSSQYGTKVESEGMVRHDKSTEIGSTRSTSTGTAKDRDTGSTEDGNASSTNDRTGDTKTIRRDLGTTPEGGTAPNAIVEVAKAHGLKVEARAPMTLEQLKAHIDKKHPVIVAYQAHGNPKSYKANNSGHYSVVVGYDHENIYLQDPAADEAHLALPISEFESLWHDKDKHDKTYTQLGIAIWSEGEKREETNQTSTAGKETGIK